MTGYSGPVFEVAVEPFAVARDHVAVSLHEHDRAGAAKKGLFP